MTFVLYFRLLCSFIKIGFSSFGGLSMVPLIIEEMLRNDWMSIEEVTDIVAIAEITPGPFGLNCATFAGMRAAGILGAIAANLGVSVPSLSLAAIAAFFFVRFRESKFLSRIMTGIRPACTGLILSVILSLCISNYYPDSSLSLPSVFIGLLDVILLFKLKFSIPATLAVSALAGGVCFHLFGF